MNNPTVKELRKEIGKRATERQRQASNPQKSVWVEASAGTGKTKVLSDRVLRLLLSGVRPERILCLTYTKAAAVEMSNRIAGRLSRWAVLNDKDLKDELEALLGGLPSDRKGYEELEVMARKLFAVLLDTPGGMKIQTIHGFCQEVLKRFPLEASISPYFDVLDERASREALIEIRTKLLRKVEDETDKNLNESLAYLTTNVSEFSFPKIMSAITQDRNKIDRLFKFYDFNIDKMLERLAEKLGIKPDENLTSAYQEFMSRLERDKLKFVMEAMAKGSKTDAERAFAIGEFLASENPEGCFEDYKKALIKNKTEPKMPTNGVLKSAPQVQEYIESEVERILFFENKLRAINLFTSTKSVLYLAKELIGGYDEYKKIHSKMDYEDLIVITRNLLANKSVADWVMYKLDGGIDNLLIDEAQDTSPDQWEIVKNLTSEFFAGVGVSDKVRTVFAVGDRKQSIYSFQGADPYEFEKVREHFFELNKEFEDVKLDVSFRSTSAVLETVDKVFDNAIVSQGVSLGGEKIKHEAFRKGDAGRIEFWPLFEPEGDEEVEGSIVPTKRVSNLTASSKLAKEIVSRIRNAVVNKEILSSQGRPVRYKDFLILVRKRGEFLEEFVRECKEQNVNVAGIDKIELLKQIAIQDLIAIGKFILLPTDDLTLATILKSPVFGLDDDDLFKICHGRPGTVWHSLIVNKEYKDTYEKLQELLNMADFVRPFELYSHILNKLSGRKKFVERMGLEVEDGIDEFMNLTLDFEREHIPSLQKFVDWILKDEVEIKRELEQSEADAVRIMTVHGSKGLQAPIVILPDTTTVPKSKKEIGVLWEDDVLYFPLSSSFYEERTLRINEKLNENTLEEYRRLLYVALTRAEDRLCVCGYKKSNNPAEESWFNIVKTCLGEDEVVIETEQEFEVEAKENIQKEELTRPNFSWINNPALTENALAKPYTPSKPDEEDVEPVMVSPISESDEYRYRRGKLIHKLLQFLPDVDGDRREVIAKFLDKNSDISSSQKVRIVEEVMVLLENKEFAPLFGKNSKAEVSIMGKVGDKVVSAQIDRLVVEDDKVMVVDYKTNRPAANSIEEIPSVYVKQMKAYKELLNTIYPSKEIKAFILWTDTAKMMDIFI